MLYFKNTTQIANELLDNQLKNLTGAELKTLLVVLRQTVGFIHPKDKSRRKERDWISQRFFMNKTGLSGRSVSSAIASLVSKKLIVVTNTNGNILHTVKQRRGTSRLYYASTLVLVNTAQPTNTVIHKKEVKKVHTTKQTHTKLYYEESSQGFKKLSDTERMKQIIQQQKKK